MTNSAIPLTLCTALERAFGGRGAAMAALAAKGFPRASRKAWLSADGRGFSVQTLVELLAAVPDPVRFLTDLGFAADQPWLRSLWRGDALARFEAAAGMVRCAGEGAPESLKAQLRALLPGRPADYWITPDGVTVAEQGLAFEAAQMLKEPDPSDLVDYPGMARSFLGAISVVRQANAPTRVAWDASAVSSAALAHLLTMLPRWDRGGAYLFDHQLADKALVYPSLSAAVFEVERALGIARVGTGVVQSLHLVAEAMGLERADATASALLASWRGTRDDPASFAAVLPPAAEAYACLYGLNDQGLVTRHHGFGLPPILGVPWDRLAGVPTALEPAHPEYRGLYLSHLLECAGARQPSLYRVQGKVGGLSGGYCRLALPFIQRGATVGLLTYSFNIGGVECLSRLAS